MELCAALSVKLEFRPEELICAVGQWFHDEVTEYQIRSPLKISPPVNR